MAVGAAAAPGNARSPLELRGKLVLKNVVLATLTGDHADAALQALTHVTSQSQQKNTSSMVTTRSMAARAQPPQPPPQGGPPPALCDEPPPPGELTAPARAEGLPRTTKHRVA